MGQKKSIAKRIIQEHNHGHARNTKHKLFLSLQFTTSDFGFSLLTKEREEKN
jgi:hypothetical protein